MVFSWYFCSIFVVFLKYFCVFNYLERERTYLQYLVIVFFWYFFSIFYFFYTIQ